MAGAALPPAAALAPPRSLPTPRVPRAERRRARSGSGRPCPAHPGTRTAPTSTRPPPSSLRGPRGCRAARASLYGTGSYRRLRDLPVLRGKNGAKYGTCPRHREGRDGTGPGSAGAAEEPLPDRGTGTPQSPLPRPPHLRQVRGSAGPPRRRPVRLRRQRRQEERERGSPGPGRMNNPIPSNLKSEAKKAAKILREFTEITSRNGPDKIIPPHVIAKAKGLAVLSVIKAGFLVTARGGSGIVLARLPNGTWSAPSAIGIAGLGGGFEIGIEVSDLVIILNHERAVEAFAKGGNLTLGGNLTVAIGPLGRNLEGDVALRSSAAVYTYCKSRGLFAGVSLEGTCLIERKETNRKFYGQDIRASAILLGDVPFPAQADDLYETLASFTEVYENEEQKNNPGKSVNDRPARPSTRPEPPKPTVRPTPPAKKNTNKLYPELPNDYASGDNSGSDSVEVTALYSFEGQQPGDLTFKAGDRITVTTKTNSQFDWWEGTIGGKTGIFPANYVAISNN